MSHSKTVFSILILNFQLFKDGHVCVEDAPVYSLFGTLLQMIIVKVIESEPKL